MEVEYRKQKEERKKMQDWENYKENQGKIIIERLYADGMIKTWYRDKPEGWTLVSGLWSPFYVQLRPLPLHPELLSHVGFVLGQLMHKECPDVDGIIGVAMAGIPIATAISIEAKIPSGYTRKIEGVKTKEDFSRFIKGYGEHSLVEGIPEDGGEIAIIDDLVTKFNSKEVAIEQLNFELKLRGLKGKCSHVVVLLDREQGAEESAREQGITLHSLIPFKSKGIKWLSDVFMPRERDVIADYLREPEIYQNVKVQAELRQEAESRRK